MYIYLSYRFFAPLLFVLRLDHLNSKGIKVQASFQTDIFRQRKTWALRITQAELPSSQDIHIIVLQLEMLL